MTSKKLKTLAKVTHHLTLERIFEMPMKASKINGK